MHIHFAYSTRNDSIWHGHHNEWVAIFLRSAPNEGVRESNDSVSLATATLAVFIVGTLSHVQFIFFSFLGRLLILFCWFGHFMSHPQIDGKLRRPENFRVRISYIISNFCINI